QILEEGPVLVHAVESLGLLLAHPDALLRHDAQAGGLDLRIDRAGQVAAGGIRLDDREGAFNRHDRIVLSGHWRGKMWRLYRGSAAPLQPSGPAPKALKC